MNSYELSRFFWDWSFSNPHKVKPIHSAIYFFAIEHCNRLGWKDNFGFPSQMVMEAIGVKNWRTYKKALTELVEFGFLELVEESKNQYSSNIIAIVKNTKTHTKALDKALSKHSTKHCQSTVQSTVSINKQLNKQTIKQLNQQTTLGEYSDFFNQVLDFFLIVSENHQRNVFSFLMRKINKGEIKEFVEQTNAMMQWKNKNPEEKRSNWNNYTYDYDNGTSTDWIGKLGLKVVKNGSVETIVRYKDNVNPTVRSLPKSKYLEMVEANKGGGYEYKIVSEN